MTRFRTKMPRGDTPAGQNKVVLGIMSGAYRWEFVGHLPMPVTDSMMALAATIGGSTSLNKGEDEGIAAAFDPTRKTGFVPWTRELIERYWQQLASPEGIPAISNIRFIDSTDLSPEP